MKKLLVTALFLGAYAVAQETTPAKAPSNHSIFYSLDLDAGLSGKFYEGEHFLQYTYKYANGYTFQPTLDMHSNYVKAEGATKFHDVYKNDYAQVRWNTPKLWNILGFKTNVQVRYTIPTSTTAELEGGYGSFSPRLVMEQEFNSHFNLTVIPKIPLYIQRNGNHIGTSKDPSKDKKDEDRNSLVGARIEVLPQWKIMENLTLTYDLDLGCTYVGNGGNGDHNFLVLGDFTEEIELMYTLHSAGDLGIGAIINDGDGHSFGNHAGDTKVFKGESLFAGIRLMKNIDF